MIMIARVGVETGIRAIGVENQPNVCHPGHVNLFFFTYLSILPALNSKNTHGAGHNKFDPIDSPFMPLPIPSWQNALKAVDTDPSRLDPSNRSNPHNGKYIFPEPGIFAGVQNEL
jgi:hypothetical protein